MGLFVDTVSTNVTLSDLGITLTHPTTNYNLFAQFSLDDIRRSTSLYSAITGGSLSWKLTSGGAVQDAANFDYDALELEQERSGAGYETAKTLALANSTITLKAADAKYWFFTGTTAGQIIKLPEATQLGLAHTYDIINSSATQSITIQLQDASVLNVLTYGNRVKLTLKDNSTANGVWFIESSADGTGGGGPRSPIVFTYNGTWSNNAFLGRNEVLPNTPYVFPRAMRIDDLAFANQNVSKNFFLDIYKNGQAGGDLFATLTVNTGRASGRQVFNNLNLLFAASDFLYFRYRNISGTSPSDSTIDLYCTVVG